MIRDFTATVYIIDGQTVLLHPHPKHGKWLPPGGHLEKNETPIEAAKREVMEETGLEIELVYQENIWIRSKSANSFERPFMCMIEEVEKPYRHQHVDFIYLAKPKALAFVKLPFEWIEIDKAVLLDNMYPDTTETLKTLQGMFLKAPIEG